MADWDVSVVVPFLNSRDQAPLNLKRLAQFLGSQPGSWEIIAVDDGSTDGTAQALARAAASLPGVRVLGAEVNMGKGACVGQAMRAARGERILFIDGDLPFPLEGLARVARALDDHDVAIACRARPHPSNTDPLSRLRGELSLAFSALTRRLLLPDIADTQAGLKGFRREAAALVLERQSRFGFCFDLEALVVARRFGLSVAQLELPWDGHGDSTIRLLRDGPSMLLGLAAIALRLFAGAYEHAGPPFQGGELREVKPAAPAAGASPRQGLGRRALRFVLDHPIILLLPLSSAVIAYWFLPELLHSSLSLNDGVLHFAIVRTMDHVWSRGGDIFDFWQRNSGSGHAFMRTSHFLLYLSAWALRQATFHFLPIETCFTVMVFATVVLLPWSLYAGGRLLGLDVAESAAAAALLPLVRDVNGFGIFLGNYVWSGHGLYNQAFGLLTLPITMGLLYRGLRRPRWLILAAISYTVTWMSHLFLGYMAFIWSLACAAYLAAADSDHWEATLGRWLGIQALFAVIGCGLLVPILQDRLYQLRSLDEPAYRFLGHGAAAVLTELLTGRLFDAGSYVPMVTILVLGGFAYCVFLFFTERRRRADSPAGLIAVQAALALFLSFGPVSWGSLSAWLPFSEDVHWHRFIVAAQVMFLYAAGIVLVAGYRYVRRRAPSVRPYFFLALAAGALANGATLDRYFRGLNQRNLIVLETAWRNDTEFHKILRFALDHEDARIYSGTWGDFGKDVVLIPGYPFFNVLNQFDANTISMLFHTLGLSSPLNFSMDFADREDARLANVRYAVLPSRLPAPKGYRPILAGPKATVYDNGDTEGFFMLGSPAPARCADDDTLFYSIHKWIRGPGQDAGTFPEILMDDECPRGTNLLINAVSEVAPRKTIGRVLKSGVTPGKDSAHYWARVQVDSPGLIVFKMEYHPSWQVLLNGQPAQTFMVLPAFIAVRVEPGVYRVDAEYVSSGLRRWLLLAGSLFALGLLWWWRRTGGLEAAPAPEPATAAPARGRGR